MEMCEICSYLELSHRMDGQTDGHAPMLNAAVRQMAA